MAKFTRWVPIGFCDDQQAGVVSADGLTYFPATGVVVQRLGETEQVSPQAEGGRMSFAHVYNYEGSNICEFCGDDVGTGEEPERHQLDDCPDFAGLKLAVVEDFWRKVCELAHRTRPNTVRTERYSGAYYAAATEIIAEMRRAGE